MKRLLFAANDGSLGFEYYLTDGSTVTLIGDLNPGPGDSYQFNDDFAQIGADFLFAANAGQAGVELFASDGTSAGTALLKDINFGPDSSSPIILETLGGKTYFAAITAAEGDELWVSDGTSAGTLLVRDIRPGAPNSGPSQFEIFGGKLLFTADNGVTGRELYVSDGTALGTQVVKDINTGAAASNPEGLSEDGSNILGSKLFFSAESGAIGRELWMTDGTDAGTVLVRDIRGAPPEFAGNTQTTGITSAGTSLRGSLETDGDTDWYRIELSAGQGYRINLRGQQIDPGNTSLLPDPLAKLFDSNGAQVLGTATGGNGNFTLGAGATPVQNDDLAAPLRDAQLTFTANTTGTFFISAESFGGAADRTGTYSLTVIQNETGFSRFEDFTSVSSSPDNFQAFAGFMFFTANDGLNGTELWATDGTSGGTQLVKDINPTGSSNPFALTPLGDKLVFAADNGSTGTELWVSNGTPQGTMLLRDINGGSEGSDPGEFVQLGSRLIFAATDGGTGRELYATDGTVAGTGLLVDILSGAGSSDPVDLLLVGDKVFFSAATTANGRELWMTDGTVVGTVRVTDLDPGADSSSPDLIGVFDVAAANTPPTGLALSNLSVAENSASGTVVGTLSATDADGDPLSFSLTDTGGGRFSISGSSLVVAGALDFETQSQIAVTAQASDGKGGTVSSGFTIQVTDVSEGGGGTQTGDAGNNTLQNTAGADSVFFLGGTDTFVYNTTRAGLEDTLLPNGQVRITELSSFVDDILDDVEIVRMLDGDYRFDMLDGLSTNVTGTSTQDNLEFVYRLYAASLGRTPGADGLRAWLERLLDGRQDRDSLADAFVLSPEFQSKFGGISDPEDLITLYFTEILDRPPAQSGLDFWSNKFRTGSDLSDLLTSFAVSPEFVNNNADNYDDGVFTTRGAAFASAPLSEMPEEGFPDLG